MDSNVEMDQVKEILLKPKQKKSQYDHNFLFTTLSPLIKHIRQLQNKIENDYIKQYVTRNTSVQLLIAKIDEYIENKQKKYSPTLLLINMSGGNLLLGFLYYTLNSGIIYLSIFLGLYLFLIQLLNIVTNDFHDNDTKNKLKNILILFSMIILSFLSTYLGIKCDWTVQVWKSQIKITLQYLLNMKALKTKQFVNKKEQKKDGKKNKSEDADIINLMTVDTELILGFSWGLTRGLVSIVTIGICLYMLQIQVGSAVNNGISILGGSFIYNIFVVIIIQKSFMSMLQQKDKRISLSTDLIEGMKSIKYLCWEQIFDKKIMDIRKKEYFSLTIIRTADGFLALFWSCLNYVLLFAFLMSYINIQKISNVKEGSANIFAVIALFGILVFPLGIIPWALTNLYKSYSSYNRILKFLNEKEIDESEITRYNDYNSYKHQSYISDQSGIKQDNRMSGPSLSQIENQYMISISNVIFKWPERSQLVKKESDSTNEYQDFQLTIDDLKIQSNRISFVIGKLGSGKSALLFGLMNEMENIFLKNTKQSEFESQINEDNVKMHSFKGKQGIEIRGSIALVTQNHWLQNVSIRENILFGSKFDYDWYQECIQACQLDQDFKSFPNGDRKTVSANGGNLSGGQKQRISIARAIYANRDIYLFDDIFSSLDVHVSDAIFEKAIKGLLISRNKTVLLVTSHYKYLQEPNTDIIFLEKGRQVTNKETIKNYLQVNLEKQSKKEKEEDEKHKQDLILDDIELDEEALLLKRKTSSKKVQDEEDEEINEEYRDKGKISLETFLIYIRACRYWAFALLFGFTILMQASRSVIDFWLRSEISDFPNQIFITVDHWFNDDFSETFAYLIVLNVVVTFIRVSMYVLCASFAAHLLFKKLNSCIMYSNLKFFDNNPSGRIINRLSSDVLAIDDTLPWFVHTTLETLASCLGFPIGVAIYFPWMGVIILMGVFMMSYVMKLYRPSNREIKRLSSVNNGKLISILGEVCRGLPIIRAFKNQEWIIQQYIKKLNDSIDTWVLTTAVFIWLEVRILLIGNVFFISSIVTCIILYGFELTKDFTTLSITMTYSLLSLSSFNDLMFFVCNCEQQFVSVERIKQYYELNEKEDMDIVQNIGDEMNNNDQNENLELDQYSLVFENVYLTYDEKEVENKKYALKNFNLKIRKGEKIGICGRTGSGKSSLLNILFRLYDIEKGKIFIKQKEIRTMSLRQLRSQMSIIPQFGFLYHASLKDNLDPSNEFSEESVQKIIQESGLNIIKHRNKEQLTQEDDEDIEEEEKIIDCNFMIENSGGNLSNGEKQIINFLRIIMKDKDIICLDEATSNMDPKSDEILHDKLFSYAEGKTLIVITHRLENIDKFDRIVVLEQGEIVEMGHVSELRKINNGFFNKLLKH